MSDTAQHGARERHSVIERHFLKAVRARLHDVLVCAARLKDFVPLSSSFLHGWGDRLETGRRPGYPTASEGEAWIRAQVSVRAAGPAPPPLTCVSPHRTELGGRCRVQASFVHSCSRRVLFPWQEPGSGWGVLINRHLDTRNL